MPGIRECSVEGEHMPTTAFLSPSPQDSACLQRVHSQSPPPCLLLRATDPALWARPWARTPGPSATGWVSPVMGFSVRWPLAQRSELRFQVSPSPGIRWCFGFPVSHLLSHFSAGSYRFSSNASIRPVRAGALRTGWAGAFRANSSSQGRLRVWPGHVSLDV